MAASERFLLYGLAIANEAVARALARRGIEAVVVDDSRTDAKAALATALDVELVAAPDDEQLEALVAASSVVVPAPGVPETHPVFATARRLGRPLRSEIELAYRWEQGRPGGPRPMLAVTGTDGKTSTTLWAVEMLHAAGVATVASGNTEVPLVEAVDRDDLDVFVVECTNHRLATAETYRAEVGVWLNFSPDHLNWHRSIDTYEAAKARLFDQQRSTDVAIGSVADPTVMRHLAAAPGQRRTFGLRDADYDVSPSGELRGPHGVFGEIGLLRRALPHDITNGLAAAALVLESGHAGVDAVAAGLASFTGPPHRIELVGEADGVRWYNDSKATTPHAASAAIRAFDHIVLIAGGLNKGLDLTPMASERQRIRAVVAIGADAADIEVAFAGLPMQSAESMADAVDRAAATARPGDVVLLSPGCASFDWYPDGGYPARGDDFRRLVQLRLTGAPT
jgi:UDP-N-acetylmuramoylalanine--D-glutamate ligase